MVTNDIGAKLHHRSVIGEKLTKSEKIQLEEWYARMDANEAALLAANAPRSLSKDEMEELRKMVKKSMGQVEFLIKKIKELDGKNEELRKQNEELKKLAMQLIAKKAA